jgi:hypothetical protein
MLRFIAQTTLAVLANAVGLIAASLLLSGFSLSGFAFTTAVLIFTAVSTLLGPFIMKQALRNAPYLMGGIALVTTLVGLIVTNILSTGIQIEGLTSWILATFIVWLFGVIASVVLPLFIFKQTMQSAKEKRTNSAL